MLSVLILHFTDSCAIKLQDLRIRVRKKYRRMRGDNELRLFLHKLVDRGQGGELPIGRERGLRLVEEIEAVAAQLVHKKGHERLAVRLPMKRLVAVGLEVAHLIHVRGDIEETLGSQEVAILGLVRASRRPQERMKLGGRVRRTEPNIFGATFRPKSHGQRNRL